jgi:Leucine-rich repeat (LRR) protein
VLNIDRNYIATLPGQLKMCTALTELRTANNQLLRLPDAIGTHFTCFIGTKKYKYAVTELRTANNQWSRLPDALGTHFTCFTGALLVQKYVS